MKERRKNAVATTYQNTVMRYSLLPSLENTETMSW